MTEAQTALARRAVACGGWRWMPGMLTTDRTRIVVVSSVLTGENPAGFRKDGTVKWPEHRQVSPSLVLPDLSDPATLGCLLALVREAWGDERTAVKWWYPEGCAYYAHPLDNWWPPATLFASEAEALVVALEASSPPASTDS